MSEKKQENMVGVMTGTAVNDARDKTVVVAVDTYKTHEKYHKKYRSTKKYKVHDAENSAKKGDTINFISCKPLSKEKSYKIV